MSSVAICTAINTEFHRGNPPHLMCNTGDKFIVSGDNHVFIDGKVWYLVKTDPIYDGPHANHLQTNSYLLKIGNTEYKFVVLEPTFKSLDEPEKLYGYHLTNIKKGEIGTVEKIQEELDELKDAEDQGVKVMQLVELSDILGAVELYLEKNFKDITIQDLIAMKDVTKRAFLNGHRPRG